MKKTIYLFNDGVLKRKDNTLEFQTDQHKKALPIEAIDQINVFGELDINKRALEILARYKILVHFFNYYGYYTGTFYPREYLNSGLMIIAQTKAYLEPKERLYLASQFVEGSLKNILKNLIYYKKTHKSLQEHITKIQENMEKIPLKKDIPSLMATEGESRKIYYESFPIIIANSDFHLLKRTKHPPDNPINALISFGNSLLYLTALSQIYQTHLDPRIGYLHESNNRSFSLNLDLAEIFKPIIVDRTIFSLLNKNQLSLKHFDKSLEYAYLNDKGRKIFIKYFENRLATTINYKNLGKVSYKRLIKLECYKLYKHFLLEELYKPFIAGW